MDETLNNGKNTGKKRRREAEEEEEDRISQLSDSLLIEILCFLPIKPVVATSTLSKRWRYLWTQVTHLDLGDLTLPLRAITWRIAIACRYHKFIDIVDTILQQLTSPKIHTLSFRVHTFIRDDKCDKCVTCYKRWIEQACLRKVEVLTLRNHNMVKSPFFRLPACLFASQSLVKLKLTGFMYNVEFDVPEEIHLPNLINLTIWKIVTNQESHLKLTRTLFKSCPALKSLDLAVLLDHQLHSIDIFASNLKSLCLDINDGSPGSKVGFVIDAPSLEHIKITGNLPYLRFVEIPSKLQIADIAVYHLHNLDRADYDSYMSGLVRGISCARFLDLGRHGLTLFSLISSVHRLPIFQYLDFIRLDISRDLPKETNWSAPLPGCLLGKLEVVHVTGRNTSENRIKLVEYILNNAPALEELSVTSGLKDGPSGDNERHIKELQEEREFSKKLSELLISRYSNRQIEFYSDDSFSYLEEIGLV